MFPEKTFDLISEHKGLNKQQSLIGERIISLLYAEFPRDSSINGSSIVSQLNKEHGISFDKGDATIVIGMLMTEFFFIEKRGNMNFYVLTSPGKLTLQNYNGSFINYLTSEIDSEIQLINEGIEEKQTKDEINKLTIESFKNTNFRYKYFWYFVVGQLVLAVVAAIIIANIT